MREQAVHGAGMEGRQAHARLVLRRPVTHHAAALTYYSLMSLFPAALLAPVAARSGRASTPRPTTPSSATCATWRRPRSRPARQLAAQRAAEQGDRHDDADRSASSSRFYGTTGVLEAARRALNVVFEAENGRSFLRRKTIDVALDRRPDDARPHQPRDGLRRRGFAEDLLGFVGLGETAARHLERRALAGCVRWRRRSRSPTSTTSRRTSSSAPFTGSRPGRDRRAFCAGWSCRSACRPTCRRSPTWARSTAPSRRDRARRLAVAHERRAAVRGRAQRRDRA